MNETMIEAIVQMRNTIDINAFSNRYTYNGNNIPRTTEILSAMLHEERLMSWANSLGFKRIGYRAFLNDAANKGTYTHHTIEHFLKNGVDSDFEGIPELAKQSTYNAYNSFKQWWECITSKNDVEIVFVEHKLTCQYFGGTLDCLLKINGAYWLVDFKTSNHVNYHYALQAASYMYMLKTEYNINIDGIVILQLRKECVRYNEYIIDLHIPEDKAYMDLAIKEFLILVAGYYGRVQLEQGFKSIISK